MGADLKPFDDQPSGQEAFGNVADCPQSSTNELEIALADRFREIAYLTLLLRQQEQRDEPRSEEMQWLVQIAVTLLTLPRWWAAMPRSWRGRKIRRLFRDQNLFDADDYLERNPDVAATGADPLRHYLQHGMREGRSRSA